MIEGVNKIKDKSPKIQVFLSYISEARDQKSEVRGQKVKKMGS